MVGAASQPIATPPTSSTTLLPTSVSRVSMPQRTRPPLLSPARPSMTPTRIPGTSSRATISGIVASKGMPRVVAWAVATAKVTTLTEP